MHCTTIGCENDVHTDGLYGFVSCVSLKRRGIRGITVKLIAESSESMQQFLHPETTFVEANAYRDMVNISQIADYEGETSILKWEGAGENRSD